MSILKFYSPKSSATEPKIKSLEKEASEQVLKHMSALEFKDRKVKAYAMVFVGSNCEYCEMQK